MTTVINKRSGLPFDVYIGRPSRWGNPFSHLPDSAAYFKVATREEAIREFEYWIYTQPLLIAAIERELKDKVLACWCKPLACHGDILAQIANDL